MMRWRYLAACVVMVGTVSAGENWPQFRGPGGQGIAEVGHVPTEWDESRNVAWKIALPGRGWSSPVVWGRQLWATTATDEGRSLQSVCVDIETGTLLHQVEVFRTAEPIGINRKNSHASPTPLIEPGRVYVHFGTLGTACLDTETGEILWTNQELNLEHKEGPGSSPIMHGDLLIVNCDGMDVQYVAALNKHTGRLAWKTDRSGELSESTDQRKAYSTPLVIDTPRGPQLVSTGADWVVAYDPTDGRELWGRRATRVSRTCRVRFSVMDWSISVPVTIKRSYGRLIPAARATSPTRTSSGGLPNRCRTIRRRFWWATRFMS